MNCPYCEAPLLCLICETPFTVSDPQIYEALSRPEVPISCDSCGAILTCLRCKTPFDGLGEDDADRT